MSSPAVTALRAEIETAISLIEPQLRGMQDLTKVSLSPETASYVSTDASGYSRRYTLLRKVVDCLDALDADGYPDIKKVLLPQSLYDELIQQRDDLVAAIGEFQPAVVAASISIAPAETPTT